MAPLEDLLGDIWNRKNLKMLAVSARTHLRIPGWKTGEEPVPGCRDDYLLLREEIAGRLNSPEFARDMRGARAEEWTAWVEDQVSREAASCAHEARRAHEDLRNLSLRLWQAGVQKNSSPIAPSQLELLMARRTWGPLSLSLLAWSFFLRLVELLDLACGFFRKFSGNKPREEEGNQESIAGSDGPLVNEVNLIAESAWPDIDVALRKAGFSASCRANPLRGKSGEAFIRRLESRIRNEWEHLSLSLTDGMLPRFRIELLFLNMVFFAPVVLLVASGGIQMWLQGGLKEGYGRESIFFVGFCWILILSIMHGWITFKVRKLAGRDSISDKLKMKDSCPVQAAPELISEVERLLSLGGANSRRQSENQKLKT
jgi:hypothetical protein